MYNLLQCEFWTNSINPEQDQLALETLYNEGFLNIYPSHQKYDSEKLWNCIYNSYKENKKGYDGKQRILSIVANDFLFQDLQSNLEVSTFNF